MKFDEAEKKLAEIANGKFHSLQYERDTHRTGEQETKCRIYIEGERFHNGNTWEDAFDQRRIRLSCANEESPD